MESSLVGPAFPADGASGPSAIGPRRRLRRVASCVVTYVASAFLGTAAHGIDPDLARCAGSDILAAYWLDPSPDESGTGVPESGGGSLVTYMVQSAQQMGLLSKLSPEERAWVDGFAAMAVIRQFPHAVILLDVRSETRSDGGEQLSGIRAALVIRTDGRNAAIERLVQNALSAYSNNEESKLEPQHGEDGDVFTLRDRRLPDWAPITWGAVRSTYVVSIGTDVFPKIAARIRETNAKTTDQSWLAKAFRMAKGADAGFALYLNMESIHRSANPALHAKIKDVQGGLHLAETERALWTLGAADRSVEVRAVRSVGGQDIVSIVADSGFLDRFGADVVPAEATRFAIVDWDPQAAFDTVCETTLAVMSPSARRAERSFWKDAESGSGIRVAEDIFGRLGSSLLIHNHPKQAFGLPLGLTFVVPVREDATGLQTSIDRLLSHLDDRHLATSGCYRLRKDSEGIWAIDFGLKSPAVGINPDWLVVSFSPFGVRENLAKLPKRQRAASLEPNSNTR